jgi:hypothetical protein
MTERTQQQEKRRGRRRELVPFVETRAFECRWIEGPGGSEARCCGARTDGGSWCPVHREVVFERRTR